MRLGALVLLLPTVALAQQQPASVTATLVDKSTRAPVEGAHVAILGTALSAITGANGRFELVGIAPGVRVLQARAVGFAVGSWLLQLAEGQAFTDSLELEPRVVALEAVRIEAAADSNDWRSEAGFEQRRQRGIGYFVTRADIRSRRPANLTDLMRGVPGLMTTCNSRTCVIQMRRSTRQCRPEYFLDGHPATFATGADFPINVVSIRGVEVYRNEFEVPAEFQKINLRCGVIAIWTIDPGERLHNP